MSPARRPDPSPARLAPLHELTPARRRLKVVFMIDRIMDDMGGTEGQVMKLVRGLQAAIDVELVVLEDSAWIRAQPGSASLRFTVLDMSGGLRRLRFWRGMAALVRHLRASRADVVHTFFPIANIVGAVAARLAGIRTVVGSRRDYGYWMSPGYLRVTRLANVLVGHLVTNAPEVKRFTVAKEGFPADRIEVIYNGLELERLHLGVPDLALKASIGIPAQHKVIALVANFRRIKRQDTLVEAFAQLCCERDDVSLLFVGGHSDPYYAEVKQRIDALGLAQRVFLTLAPGGEIARYLSIIDIGCNCSESEGLSNAVMEYMGAGVPCVVSRGGGNTDLVMHEVNGLLFDVGDATTLAGHLRRLLSEAGLAERLARAAGDRLAAEMALPVILRRFENFYHRILA
jgi:glycosyltransferase involved in cell wall biosynthesis